MSLTAVELQSGDNKVIDIAIKYGYDSPTAFKNIHGVTPSQAKDKGIVLKAFPTIYFPITIKGAYEMNYRIEKKEEFRIVGISSPLKKEIEKNFEIVPGMWANAASSGIIPKLTMMMDLKQKEILGVSAYNEADNWKYYIAVATTQPLPDSMEEYIVPAATWAIFTGEGKNTSIQELERRIVTEWLPTSDMSMAMPWTLKYI